MEKIEGEKTALSFQVVSSDSGLVSRGKEIALDCTDLCLDFLLLNFHYMRSPGPFVNILEE